MRQEKSSLLRNKGFQSLLASLLCIVLGLLIGYIVLLIINPAGAGEAIRTIVENFLYYPSAAARLRYLGNTLVKTAPLLMCSLSVLFAYKVGLFNIGAAGQYVIGAGASLYCALGFGLPWYVCLLAAIAAGAVLGAISGLLKAYRNVNEVISCIMLNWISLYLVNALLSQVKETASPYTFTLSSTNPDAILPSLGLGALFSDNQYVTIAIPLTVIVAVGIWVLLEKTKLGYELKACGFNKDAAKYAGISEKRNVVLAMVIAGALSGIGGGLNYLAGAGTGIAVGSELAQQGFLEVRPRQGTFVADYRRKGNLSTLIAIMEYQGGVLGKDEIRSILEVRRALEHLAAQRAIRYASDEALARLGDIVARIAAAQNNAQAAEAAFAFQHELALAGGNSILPLIYYSFKAPVITLWLRFCRMYGIGALCRNTETLYNYLCRRDMDGAERWIDAYLEQAIDGSQQIYEER